MNQFALDHSERFCIFRSADNGFAIPALSIRKIVPRPDMISIPHCDPILKGLCHLHNEFVPAISLKALAQVQYESNANAEQQLLVMLGPQGSWGLLIDQTITLAPLETSISTLSEQRDRWAQVTVGSASHQHQVLQILDPSAIYQYASNLLNSYWQSTDQALSLPTKQLVEAIN